MVKDTSKEETGLQKLYAYSQRYVTNSFLKKIGLNNVSAYDINLFLRIYLFPIFSSYIIYFIFSFLVKYLGWTPILLVFTLATALFGWSGGLKSGLIGMFIFTVLTFFLLKVPVIDIVFFVAIGSIIIYLIDKARRTEEIRKLRLQEKDYANKFSTVFEKYNKSLNDVKARDEFLSIASHELKMPLTTMLLKLNNSLNNIKNVSLANFSVPDLMAVLENAETQIKFLTMMINDLLNISLIATGRMTLDKTKVNLVDVTKQVLDNFSEMIKLEKYSFTIDAKAPVVGYWDSARIEQAITNLISNSMKYGEKKPIKITILSVGSTGQFVIEDRGIGIPAREQKQLFHRFKRIDPDNNHQKGLGVGLYVTRQIVMAHGGQIKIESRLNRGTKFIVELPIKQ